MSARETSLRDEGFGGERVADWGCGTVRTMPPVASSRETGKEEMMARWYGAIAALLVVLYVWAPPIWVAVLCGAAAGALLGLTTAVRRERG